MNNQKKEICKRCLLEESMRGYEKVLDNYINSMSEDLKVSKEEYENRLSKCDNCEQLLNGVCKLCGCFVKARAVKKSMGCPLDTPKWNAQKRF